MMMASSSSLDPEKERRRTTGVLTKCSTEERIFSGWAGLPMDILGCILAKLTLLADYDRFGAVCVSWRNASLDVGNRRRRLETQLSSPDNQGVPLLLLLSPRPMGMEEEDDGHQWTRSLYDVVQRKMVVEDNFKLPALPNSRGRCCGSSHGWLIIADDSLSITLLNPFYIGGGSRCQGGMIRLPPIIEHPYARGNYQHIEEDEYLSELSICKAVLSADPALAPDDYLVMVIYSSHTSLAFIKSGDKDWTYLCNRFLYPIEDVVYRNGTIYAAGLGDIFDCDTTEDFPRLRSFAPAHPSFPFWQGHVRSYYIVESPQNLLLLVVRIKLPRDNNHEPRFQTTGFKIYKLLPLGRLAWVELKSLGNYALFLGDNHSTCVLAEASNGFPRVQPNSIYFTDHNLFAYAYEPYKLRVPADMGVFSLEDQSIGQYYDLGNNLSNLVCIPPPVWFLPSFPGNWA